MSDIVKVDGNNNTVVIDDKDTITKNKTIIKSDNTQIEASLIAIQDYMSDISNTLSRFLELMENKGVEG